MIISNEQQQKRIIVCSMSTLHLSYGRVVALSEHGARADMKRLQRQIATHCASDLADKSTVTCSDRYGPALTMFALCWKCNVNLRLQMTFYPRDAMLARVIVIATCPSVCLSVCLSVTRRYCVKTKKASVMISSPSGSPKTLVF